MDDYVNVTRCIPRRLCIENVRCSPADDSTRVVDRSCVVVATAAVKHLRGQIEMLIWKQPPRGCQSFPLFRSRSIFVASPLNFSIFFFLYSHSWATTSFFKCKKIPATIQQPVFFSHYFARYIQDLDNGFMYY